MYIVQERLIKKWLPKASTNAFCSKVLSFRCEAGKQRLLTAMMKMRHILCVFGVFVWTMTKTQQSGMKTLRFINFAQFFAFLSSYLKQKNFAKQNGTNIYHLKFNIRLQRRAPEWQNKLFITLLSCHPFWRNKLIPSRISFDFGEINNSIT